MNKLAQQQFNALVEVMDKRDNFFIELRRFKERHGYIPPKYQSDYHRWEKSGGNLWREEKGVEKKLWKSAKKMAKNIKRGRNKNGQN